MVLEASPVRVQAAYEDSRDRPTGDIKEDLREMGQQFDELAKALAAGQSRREALQRFAAGVAGVVLATLPGRAAADGPPDVCKPVGKTCKHNQECCSGQCCNGRCCDVGSMCITLNTGSFCMAISS
jgi:hypothetical protein